MERRANIHIIGKNDAEIWQRFKQGDKAALEHIFCDYYDNLYNYGAKLTGQPQFVEDHIQDLFLKLWNSRQNLGDVDGIKTYLWRALRRRLIMGIQKEAHRSNLFGEKLQEDKRMRLSAEELIIYRERQNRQKKELKRALSQLSGKRAEILNLKYYEGMSYEDIKQIMGISYQTARNYVHEGLQALREYLGESSIS